MRSVPVVSLVVRASPRKRLWLVGWGLAVFLLTFVAGNGVVRRDRAVTRADLGHDFLAFYTAGTFVREGRARQLYDLEAVRQAEQATARAAGIDLGSALGPWWNPPFYALALEPLATLPYGTALDAWRWINLAALVGAAALLGKMAVTREAPDVHPGLWATAALALLLLATSMPFIQAIGHAQNTCTSLLLLSATVALWRAERAVWAGVIGGLLFYKPQLAAVVAGVMAIDLGRAAVGGLAITGVALLAITTIALPGSLGDWLHRLPANVRFMQVEHAYLWDRHVTIKAFWRLLLQGTAAGEAKPVTTVLTEITWVAVAGPLAWVAVRGRGRGPGCAPQDLSTGERSADRWSAKLRETSPNRSGWSAPLPTSRTDVLPSFGSQGFARFRGQSPDRRRQRADVTERKPGAAGRRDRLIGATVCAMPLLMPFYFDYDLLLLAVPLTLYAADRQRQRSLTVAWAVLYGWMFVNAPIASRFHVGGAAVLLTCVTLLSMRRVGRRAAEPVAIVLPRSGAVAAAA